jgi:hypothetical protein
MSRGTLYVNVAYIPRIDLPLEVRQQTGDVVLDDSGQSGLVSNRGDPSRKLRVPHRGVSTHELAVVLGELDGLVCGAEVEGAARRLCRIPLHTAEILALALTSCFCIGLRVLRRDLTKVGLNDCASLTAVKTTRVGASTEVLLSLGLHGSVDALGCLTLIEDGLRFGEGSCCDERAGRQEGDKREFHDSDCSTNQIDC